MSVISSIILSLASAAPLAQNAAPGPDFDREVRPILAENCFACHGPDKDAREGKLRLDKRDRVMGISGGDAVVVAGDREASELWYRISTDFGEDKMPPQKHRKVLTAEEIETLGRWIDDGAPWAEHWAFVPPTRPELPTVTDQDWPRDEIDLFILAAMEARAQSFNSDALPTTVRPNVEAQKSKWLRRASLALTGLPPTRFEMKAFLADESTAAYSVVVDRLLNSKSYGEHMASAWLDGARYADTNGYQNDFHRAQWPWRDWVISAFNQNLPYDQFVTWQLAGDLLPDPSDEQILATGFGRNHRTVTEAGSIDEEWRVENVVDRVETTSTVFMGLTMACARCHDHRYDPITQKEFYSFYDFFNSQDEKGVFQETRGNAGPTIRVPSDEQLQQLDELTASVDVAKQQHADAVASREHDFSEWKKSLPEKTKNEKLELWSDIVRLNKVEDPRPDLGQHFSPEHDQAFSFSAWVRPRSDGTVIGKMDAEAAYRGIDLTLIENRKIAVHLIHNWPSNAVKVVSNTALQNDVWNHVAASYDGSGKASGVQIYFNGVAVDSRVAADTLNGSILTDVPLRLGQRSTREHLNGDIFGARFDLNPEFDTGVVQNDAFGLWATLQNQAPDSALSNADLEQVFASCFHPASLESRNTLQQKQQQLNNFQKDIPTVMVMKDLAAKRATYLLQRGRYDAPATEEILQAGVPVALPGWDNSYPQNRLGLAQWLVNPNHPLTARVAVNRIWQQLYGTGLVKTSENFGIQGSRPSHPALLDWLALEFVDSGWNIKMLQKRIVLSATFRQSSSADPQNYADDPENYWLSRGPRFRLTAETIRDQALAASGLLVQKIGGPPTRPHQPAGLWTELAGGAGQGPYVEDKGDGLWRRSIYTHRKRSVPHPTLTTFDAPSFETCLVRRPRTNTPLQALATLNDPTYVEAARRLGADMMEQDLPHQKRLAWGFEQLTCRQPSAAELKILSDALSSELRYTPKDPSAAWAAVAAILLNLDEVLNCD